MTLRLSCADSAFPKIPHDTSLAVISGLGFDAADVCVFEGYEHTTPATVLADPAKAADEVRERLDRHELITSDVFLILGQDFQELAPNNPDPAVREEALESFEKLLDFARRLDSPGITVLPGAEFDGVDPEESLELAAAELNRRAELAGEAGLKLAFEPHFGSIVQTVPRTLQLLEHTPKVGLALDYSHFVFQGIPVAEVDQLLPRTYHFHVRQGGPGVIQARTREGEIDFERVRDDLLGQGYTGYFCIEYQWEDGWGDFTRVDCISETADMRDLLLEGMENGGSR
jgi:sugar phosphate isomerase/epimerase